LTLIAIEVVYAEPDRQICLALQLAAGTLVGEALAEVSAEIPGVDLGTVPVGIFGEVCTRSRRLQDGDRIEIYRTVEVNAKEARRRRAEEQAKGR